MVPVRRHEGNRRAYLAGGGLVLGLLVIGAAAPKHKSKPPAPSASVAQQPPQAPSPQEAPAAQPDKRGTEDQPLVVKTIQPPESAKEATQDQAERDEKTASDWWLVWLTGGLVFVGIIQAIIFGIQAVVFWVQASRLKATIQKMDEVAAGQTADMAKSIAEASRAASAMEKVAASIAANVETTSAMALTQAQAVEGQQKSWAMQMRAYIVVIVGAGIYQERDKGIKFEGKPQVINAGMTPAYKFRRRIKAKVLDIPVAKDFQFDLPEDPGAGANAIGPRQEIMLSHVVDEMVPDDEVEEIKTASNGRALCVWGRIDYEDMFGKPHFTNFFQTLTWLCNGRVVGYYHPDFNDSN